MKRKPGEPIYLKRHILGLALALVFPILLPLLYHSYVETVELCHPICRRPTHRRHRSHRTVFQLPGLGTEPAITSLPEQHLLSR